MVGGSVGHKENHMCMQDKGECIQLAKICREYGR